jgi:acetyl/propionyl-CoA carboxylase alpha subunit
VQVFGDDHGRVVHLFERECSVQRRHQKIIEESPSPVVSPQLRERMTSAAVAAAVAAGYRNAGTVEFLVDVSTGGGDPARFYFLEMNTRLQVEHPVTEEATGLDLVRAQILVAAGEPLPWADKDIRQRGHVIEARLYAEDPTNNFLPQAGPLLLYREPRLPGIRIDSGVCQGGHVSIHYDPIMAKVIASAETRALAIAKLTAALRAFPILGVRTNVPFLLRILADRRFHQGDIDTGFLDRDGAELAGSTEEMPQFVRDASVLHDQPQPSTIDGRQSTRTWDPWG